IARSPVDIVTIAIAAVEVIVPVAAPERVASGAANQDMRIEHCSEDVVSIAAVDVGRPEPADQVIVAFTAGHVVDAQTRDFNMIISVLAPDHVAAEPAGNIVIATAAIDQVDPTPAYNGVVALITKQAVDTSASFKRIVSFAAIQDVHTIPANKRVVASI